MQTKSVELSGRRGVPSDRRARILSPGSSQTPSSGSDIVNEGPFPNTNKNRESAHRPSNRHSPARPRDDQPDHGMYGPQGSQSQPNISKVDMPHDPIRHCSLSAEPDRDMANHQLAESVSDIFSSLGSVSSEHTPCSLHDSGNEQPVDLREQRLRPERDGSRERMYSGAERAGPNGSSQALTRDGRSNRSSQRYASESELVNPSGPRLGNPDQNRPKSALQRLDDIDQNRWQENDKDPENKRATWAQENMNGNYNKLPPAGNHFRPRSLQRSLDAINVQSMDGNQRTTINTPATSGSMTPTSVDTVISNPYQGSVTHGTDGPMPSEVFDKNKPFQYGNREKNPTQFGSSDMSHLRPQPTPSSPADDGVSETLMPPPHAVVSGTRWEENQLPSFAPELLPDVPVLQKNPNHGRTKTVNEGPEPKKSEAIHFVQPTVVSAPDPGTNSDYTTRMKFSDSSMNNRPPLHKSSYFNQKPAESAVPSNYRRPESYTPIPMSNEVGNRPPPGAFPSTVLTASPPPTPTADCPQYHPPDRLQPADWSTYTSSSVPEKSHLHSVPQTAPKPNSVAPFSYHLRPETHQIRVRSPSPARYEGSVSPRPELGNAGLSTTHTQHVTQPPLSAAARVAQLESEIASIEAKQSISGAEDINPTLDRLRVELQFQRRLADRESSRIHSTSIMEAQPDLRNDERISSIREVKRPVEIQDTTNRTSQIWEQKRTEAERELENTQNRRLAELEQEHRAMLMRQEQRAKERSEWLEKHQNRSEILRNGTKDDYSKFRNQPLPKKPSNEGTAKPLDSHVRYGRPKFDATQQGSMTTNFAPQYPIQSRLGPQVVESELPRSSPALITGDSQRVKKSVSFDKNLEIISVYSPPGTPQESVAENPPSKPLHGLTNSRLPQADRPTNPSSSEYYSRSYAINDSRHLDTEKVTTVPKSKSSMSISRTAGPSVIQSGGSSTSSVNPVPDAELLPFKEKMRLFAQQIGEELPKERSRMSNRQRELLQNPTSAKFGTRPVPVYNDPRSSDFLR
ncbi:unnamed protein product [Calicophoron daubneyi]|uniref:Uncharacterized protein n=1 Tax=Calicophoron daubneyi TaxID=300641 RepID=A0AAV2TJ91_CALDB